MLPTDMLLAVHDQVVHRTKAPSPARPNALQAEPSRTPTCAEGEDGRVRAPDSGPVRPRDRAILLRLARHRILSLTQVHRLVFPGLDRSRASRRIAALVRGGWVRRWELPVPVGGRPTFVLPSATGLRWALDRLADAAEPWVSGRLVATMLRRSDHRPLAFTRGTTPPSFPHLHEVNEILVALALDPSLAVLWASSWNRPLPNTARGVALPQPDAVVVVAFHGAEPTLLFLEHDRGGENLDHFRTRKVDRYRALAQRPALTAELTGFRAFRVCVTVQTGDPLRTAARAGALRACIASRLAEAWLHVVEVDPGTLNAALLLGRSGSEERL